jgi:hypothetical protein
MQHTLLPQKIANAYIALSEAKTNSSTKKRLKHSKQPAFFKISDNDYKATTLHQIKTGTNVN